MKENSPPFSRKRIDFIRRWMKDQEVEAKEKKETEVKGRDKDTETEETEEKEVKESDEESDGSFDEETNQQTEKNKLDVTQQQTNNILNFLSKILEHSGDPDTWTVDEWPTGEKWSEKFKSVQKWLIEKNEKEGGEGGKSEGDEEKKLVEELLTQVEDWLLKKEKGDSTKEVTEDEEKDEGWYRACLYSIEGALGLRRF